MSRLSRSLVERSRRPWYQAQRPPLDEPEEHGQQRRRAGRAGGCRSTSRGIAKLRWNWTMVKPRPLLAANISLITMRMIADRQGLAQRPRRSAGWPRAGRDGAAAPSRVMPVDRGRCRAAPRRRPRTPSTVLSRIGQTQPDDDDEHLHRVADAGEQHEDRHQHRRRDRPEELQHRLDERRAGRRLSRSRRRAPTPSDDGEQRSRPPAAAGSGSDVVREPLRRTRSSGERAEDRRAAAASRSRAAGGGGPPGGDQDDRQPEQRAPAGLEPLIMRHLRRAPTGARRSTRRSTARATRLTTTPRSPVTTTSAYIGGDGAARTGRPRSRLPRPGAPMTSSPVMARISATAAASRTPVMTYGSAVGHSTCGSAASGRAGRTARVSSATGSTSCDAVEHLDEHLPERRVDDQQQRRPQVGAVEQDGQRDQRDRGDRAAGTRSWRRSPRAATRHGADDESRARRPPTTAMARPRAQPRRVSPTAPPRRRRRRAGRRALRPSAGRRQVAVDRRGRAAAPPRGRRRGASRPSRPSTPAADSSVPGHGLRRAVRSDGRHGQGSSCAMSSLASVSFSSAAEVASSSAARSR